MLLAKGYPDIGWNPCGGEKYLDFLRFAVFVNGERCPQVSPGVPRVSPDPLRGVPVTPLAALP